MLSEIGQVLRKMRIDRQELLKEMAEKLEVSSAYLSSIETGRRKIPNGFIDKIENRYSLTETEKCDLERASISDKEEVRISVRNSTKQQKDLVLSFAKALDGLTDQDVERLMKAITSANRGNRNRATKRRG